MPKDPVCDMDVDPEDAAGRSEYGGRTYYFCSVACKQSFDENPEAYLKSEASSEGKEPTEAAKPPEAPEERGPVTEDIPISGMHCAGCAQTIEKTLHDLEGVRGASVNFAAEMARVEYDPSRADRQNLAEAVEHNQLELDTQGLGKAADQIVFEPRRSCPTEIIGRGGIAGQDAHLPPLADALQDLARGILGGQGNPAQPPSGSGRHNGHQQAACHPNPISHAPPLPPVAPMERNSPARSYRVEQSQPADEPLEKTIAAPHIRYST